MDWYHFEMMEEVNKNGMALSAVSPYLITKRVVMSAVRQNGMALQYAPGRSKDDKEVVMAAVRQNGFALQYASDRLKDDIDIVASSVQKDGYALKFASVRLQMDESIISFAVQQNGYALQFSKKINRTSGRLNQYSSKPITLLAVQQNGLSLRYIINKSDKEVVMTAITNNVDALAFASPELRNDKEVVLFAVEKNIHALQFASDGMKNDKEIITIAVKKNAADRIGDCPIFNYASAALKNDKAFVMELLRIEGVNILRYLSDALKNDKEVVMKSLEFDGRVLEYASDELRNDKEVVMFAVQVEYHGEDYALYYASDALQNDKEVVMASVNNEALSYIVASEALRADPEVACTAIQKMKEMDELRYLDQLLENIPTSLDENDQFIQCMVDHKIPPLEREKLKSHMMQRVQFQKQATRPGPFNKTRTNKLINAFLGGTRKRYNLRLK